MKTYELQCEGETHRIGLDDEGYLYALDHSEEEVIAAELGDEPSECMRVISLIKKHDQGFLNKRLWRYVNKGYKDEISFWLSLGADGGEGLVEASGGGLDRSVRILIGEGVDIHTDDGEALRLAALFGHANIVEMLLGAGATHKEATDAIVEIEKRQLMITESIKYEPILRLLYDHLDKFTGVMGH